MPAVYPIEWVPPVKTGRYRNLQRRDTSVWERWLDKYGSTVDVVAYDVAVGGVEPTASELSEVERRGFKYSTSLKIDVLLRIGAEVWAVEVKPTASVAAVGAALGYPLLLSREEADPGGGRGGVLCGGLPPAIQFFFRAPKLRASGGLPDAVRVCPG